MRALSSTGQSGWSTYPGKRSSTLTPALCATAAQNVVTMVSTTHTFTVTGATLNPGDLITLAVHGLATEVGGGGGDDVYVAISDIHLAMSVKG